MKTLLTTTAIAIALAASAGSALADTEDKKIALSNNYAGNSWRQAMLRSWDKVTKPAVEQGIVAAADPFTTAENQVTEQAAQIQNLVLQGYNAIVLNAASPDALNGAVKEACDAGVTVVSFDGIVTEPCAWRIAVDFKQMGKDEVLYLQGQDARRAATCSKSAASPASSSTTRSPRASTRASPRTRSSRSSAPCTATGTRPRRRPPSPASCRACPRSSAVVTQGGDGYGAAQAFAAAGRPTPLIIMGNRQDELQWWKEQKDASGYETMSVSIAPGVSTLAFWVAQQILDGKEVPKDLVVPFLRIDQDNLETNLASTETGGVANVEYSSEDAQKVIDAAK